MTQTDEASAHDRVSIAGVMGKRMSLNTDEDLDATETAEAGQEPLAPYIALDRLLRYARSEALSQNREKTASLIEAAIFSLSDTGGFSRH
jgi:hypothetical protein